MDTQSIPQHRHIALIERLSHSDPAERLKALAELCAESCAAGEDWGDLWLRLRRRLVHAPLCRAPGDVVASWFRYLSAVSRNARRERSRAERRRRRHHDHWIRERCWRHNCDQFDLMAVLDHLDAIERRWRMSSDVRQRGDAELLGAVRLAYANGCESIRDAATFVGANHTAIRRLFARVREAA